MNRQNGSNAQRNGSNVLTSPGGVNTLLATSDLRSSVGPSRGHNGARSSYTGSGDQFASNEGARPGSTPPPSGGRPPEGRISDLGGRISGVASHSPFGVQPPSGSSGWSDTPSSPPSRHATISISVSLVGSSAASAEVPFSPFQQANHPNSTRAALDSDGPLTVVPSDDANASSLLPSVDLWGRRPIPFVVVPASPVAGRASPPRTVKDLQD
ncbi:hypothetical protein T484DRAFT_3301618 [Baffinella frigidus]|nr:hypothetical protein T484DRAFT_3301618 [Cryptophyta sp. CCMP2293]